MSSTLNVATAKRYAAIFSAMGDETRLALVTKLARGEPCSIAQLTQGTQLTRQAITKHLNILLKAGVVTSNRTGRENIYELKPDSMRDMQRYLQAVGKAWEESLQRLKLFVESKNH